MAPIGPSLETHFDVPGGVGLNITGRSKRKFKPNIQRVRALIDGETRRVKICTRCLKSGVIQKPVSEAQIAR